jgi:hypothetical protein
MLESMATSLSNSGILRYASDIATGGVSGRDQRVTLWPALRALIEPYYSKPAMVAHQSGRVDAANLFSAAMRH